MSHSGNYDYDYDDLLHAYAALGVTKGSEVYVGSDLTRLMQYAIPGRDEVLEAHFRALTELLGPTGTLFVPTASLNLCNTDRPFDPYNTPSSGMGMFSEYVRRQPGAIRSFHPFWSLSGIGPAAKDVLNDVSRHAYGLGSVFHRFVERDVLGITIGISPQSSISVIHFIETVMGVPYRYTKEFIHPVFRDGTIVKEPFYLSVLYKDCDIVRGRNRKIFENFSAHGTLNTAPIGRGAAWSFSHREFFSITTKLFRQDIYAWLDHPPLRRPYQN